VTGYFNRHIISCLEILLVILACFILFYYRLCEGYMLGFQTDDTE